MTEQHTGAPLTADEFPDFYRAVHGVTPFPWQSDLTARVLAGGEWPDLVDVPTGLGKTSMLDIAVFVTAATAHIDGLGRTGRRRLFFVVDRRLVVDEAYEHARRLSATLQHAIGHPGVLGQVAAKLRSLAPHATDDLLPVTRMRGGTTWAAAWLDRPDRPGIVLGTVDQVGSRLLFRGYGVSDRRRPLDAALVGTDSLIMVDEAHLATALLTTLHAAQARDRLGLPLPAPRLLRLSATAEATTASYRLDLDTHRDVPLAWQRLTAGKRLTLRETTPKNAAKELVNAVVEQLALLTGGTGETTAPGAGWTPVALVVCNTVDRAREVYALLRTALAGADCDLLIGRSRPLDRPGLHTRVQQLLGTGRSPAPRPAALVATQTVEVGVNLDADVLATESASWDVLVQRLGRLNRLGQFPQRFPDRTVAQAVVVHDGQRDGPVYGAARDRTWETLTALATQPAAGIDVSPLACTKLTATTFADGEFSRAPHDVPVLLSPTLDAWVQTGPVPLNDPPVAPYLHGFDGGTAPVQVIWREGLLEPDLLASPFNEEGDAERAAPQIDALLAQSPPRTPEIVEIPFVAVRRWMSGQATGPVGDVDVADEVAPRTTNPATPFRALVQRPVHGRQAGDSTDAPSRWQWIDDRQLRPGDRIVVPAERGGLDAYGWAPRELLPVPDVSEAAAFTASRSRREAALRLDPGLVWRLGLDDTTATMLANALLALTTTREDDEPARADEIDSAARLLAEHLPATPPPATGWAPDSWATLRAWLTSRRLRIVDVDDPTATWFGQSQPWLTLLSGPRPDMDTTLAPTPDGDDDEVAASSVAPAPVTLTDHHQAVRHRAGEIARALHLPAALRSVVEDAAGWHDLGKVEQRFQVMLHDGDPTAAALAVEPLAKSGMDPTDRMSWRRARRQSNLPAGARHEAWSAALIEDYLTQPDTAYPGDADLLLHLVASHHGYARPLARLVTDPDPHPIQALFDGRKVTVASDRTVSLDHPARFHRLNQRYGRWGLALLEAIVRCADTTVSGEGS